MYSLYTFIFVLRFHDGLVWTVDRTVEKTMSVQFVNHLDFYVSETNHTLNWSLRQRKWVTEQTGMSSDKTVAQIDSPSSFQRIANVFIYLYTGIWPQIHTLFEKIQKT